MSNTSIWRHPNNDLPMLDDLVQVHVLLPNLARCVCVGWWSKNGWNVLNFNGLIEKEGEESYSMRVPRIEGVVLEWCPLCPTPIRISL